MPASRLHISFFKKHNASLKDIHDSWVGNGASWFLIHPHSIFIIHLTLAPKSFTIIKHRAVGVGWFVWDLFSMGVAALFCVLWLWWGFKCGKQCCPSCASPLSIL
jgi:hypothetical protein